MEATTIFGSPTAAQVAQIHSDVHTCDGERSVCSVLSEATTPIGPSQSLCEAQMRAELALIMQESDFQRRGTFEHGLPHADNVVGACESTVKVFDHGRLCIRPCRVQRETTASGQAVSQGGKPVPTASSAPSGANPTLPHESCLIDGSSK